jgi:hypothetical protein
LLLRLEQALL